MNSFDEKYDIRLARYDEVPLIMEFIDAHWRKDHIMSRDRELFEYEFVDKNKVHVLIAVDRETNSIQAMYGFLFSSKTEGKRDIWGSIWKANDDVQNIPMLGLELAKRLEREAGARYRIGIGLNSKTAVPIERYAFKRHIFKMKQWFYLNRSIGDYKIAIIKDIEDDVTWENEKSDIEICDLKSIEEFEQFIRIDKYDQIPYKDNWYINHRYYEHPRYKYRLVGMRDKDDQKGVLVLRGVAINDRRVMRIVDYIGNKDIIGKAREVFDELVFDYEYIDFWEYGLDDKIMQKAGFVERSQTRCVIPNYFEPFVQENVEIFASSTESEVLCFKADGDQDRPNI